MDVAARSRRTFGFTLIEIVVVVSIIVIVMGFSAPAFIKMFQNRRLEGAGTLIGSAINEARNDAVTKKQVHRIVFLRDGFRVYREPKGADKGGFQEGIRPYDPDRTGLEYDLVFAGRPYTELPTDLAIILDSKGTPPPPEEWTVTDEETSIRFLPDGTVDFGKFEDVPSFQFNATPPESADIIIRQKDDKQRGYLDIRPTGRSAFKVEAVE
jgi:prepilin-type N-terminal cleavage/methylation domain-containing protein